MTELDWKRMVDADAKSKVPIPESEVLRRPDNLIEWKGHLALAIAAIDAQIAANDYGLERLEQEHAVGRVTDEQYVTKSNNIALWRRKALFSKAKYVERLKEAKILIARRNAEPEWQRSRVIEIRKAIAEHRQAIRDDEDVEPSKADLALWSILGEDDT